MIGIWLKRWGRSPEEISQKVQALGLIRTGQLISRLLGKSPPEAREVAPWLQNILEAAMEVMCAYDEEMPDFAECGALEAACGFTTGMPHSTQEEFQSLLAVLEVAPYVFGPRRKRFTELSSRDREVHLQGWERSMLAPRRGAFGALKSVVMMGYWTRPEAFSSIGYSVASNPGVPEPQLSQWQAREEGHHDE